MCLTVPLCLLAVIYQTDLLAQQHVRPPLHLTPLINRWPTSESGLWPCHSLARLIGFHLSLHRKGMRLQTDKQSGTAWQSASTTCLNPLWQERRLRVRESGRLENREFEGQVVYCRVAARMMEVAASTMWLGVFRVFSLFQIVFSTF